MRMLAPSSLWNREARSSIDTRYVATFLCRQLPGQLVNGITPRPRHRRIDQTFHAGLLEELQQRLDGAGLL